MRYLYTESTDEGRLCNVVCLAVYHAYQAGSHDTLTLDEIWDHLPRQELLYTPVMPYDQWQVQDALDRLRHDRLVSGSWGRIAVSHELMFAMRPARLERDHTPSIGYAFHLASPAPR